MVRARHRVILGVVWVDDRRTVSNRTRQRETIQVHGNNPGRGKHNPKQARRRRRRRRKPYSDGNCFSGGHKWFSPYTGGSWWFNCRPSPGCRCFSLTTPWKSPAELPTVFWQTPRSCGNLIAVRIHISEFTRRNRFKIQCLIPFWALTNTVTLYFGVIYILFLKCWKVTILHDCSTTATGSRKRRKAHTLSNGSLLWQQQVCNTILKCVL